MVDTSPIVVAMRSPVWMMSLPPVALLGPASFVERRRSHADAGDHQISAAVVADVELDRRRRPRGRVPRRIEAHARARDQDVVTAGR
jgi:hypothetical protein